MKYVIAYWIAFFVSQAYSEGFQVVWSGPRLELTLSEFVKYHMAGTFAVGALAWLLAGARKEMEKRAKAASEEGGEVTPPLLRRTRDFRLRAGRMTR